MTDGERTKGPQETATELALAGASWLDGPEYLAAKASLLGMARKLDGWDAVVQAAVEYAEEKSGRRPTVPLHDGTTYGSYTRLLAEMGLTAASRAKLDAAGTFMVTKDTTTKTDGGADAKHDDTPADVEDDGKLARITALRP